MYIFFDTTTYDEIERDVKVMYAPYWSAGSYLPTKNKKNPSSSKVTMEAALGLIGGTMGLLTGFSILSGIEILYYIVRFGFMMKLHISLSAVIYFIFVSKDL